MDRDDGDGRDVLIETLICPVCEAEHKSGAFADRVHETLRCYNCGTLLVIVEDEDDSRN